jgi:transposase
MSAATPTATHSLPRMAPPQLPASSGRTVRHRFNPGGNRQLNRALYTIAITQIRGDTEGRAYYERKRAAGKTKRESLRCLKRRLSDIVYRTMLSDYVTGKVTGPGGQRGNDSDSSATGSQPHTGSSDKSLPGPVTTNPRTPIPTAS